MEAQFLMSGLRLEFLDPFLLSMRAIEDWVKIVVTGIKTHNTAVLKRLNKGDLVQFKRPGYSHWAVYAGNEKVIHLVSNRIGAFKKVSVREENIQKVANGGIFYKNNSKDYKIRFRFLGDEQAGSDRGIVTLQRPSPDEEIIERARAKLGDIDYHVLWSNCEHFASYCRYGNPQSDQADVAGVTGLTLVASGILHLLGI